MWAYEEKTANSDSKSDLKNELKQELKSELKNELKIASKIEKESENCNPPKNVRSEYCLKLVQVSSIQYIVNILNGKIKEFPELKCISKISAKEGFLKNEAFYFTTAVIGVEVVMVIASVYNGIASVGQFMKSMIKMNGGKSMIDLKKNNISIDISNSNRILNNPPKIKKTNDEESNI